MFFYLIQFDETNNLKIKFMKNVLFGLLAFMGFCSNAQNVIEWKKCIGGTSFDEASSILQTTDGGYIVASVTNSNNGNVSGNHGVQDAWVMKLSNTLGILEPLNSNSFSFFPNPVTNCINLKLDIENSNQTYIIRDTLGKIITQGKISGPFTSINVEYLSGGVYFIAVGQSKNIKFIKK